MKRPTTEKPQLTFEDVEQLERSWREGWAVEFPGEPWPGTKAAIRQIREKYSGKAQP